MDKAELSRRCREGIRLKRGPRSAAHEHNLAMANKVRCGKPVVCLNTGREYLSQNEAATDLGLYANSVSRVARGVQKDASGYVFEYIELLEVAT